MEYHNKLMSKIPIAKVEPTAAEKPHIQELENKMTEAVQKGLNPQAVLNMTTIICILVENGISVDILEKHHILISGLCIISNHSTDDNNINNIINQIRQAENTINNS